MTCSTEGELNYLCRNCHGRVLAVYKLSCFGCRSLDLLFVSKSASRLIYFNVNIALAKFVDNKWLKKGSFALCFSEEMVCIKIEQTRVPFG